MALVRLSDNNLSTVDLDHRIHNSTVLMKVCSQVAHYNTIFKFEYGHIRSRGCEDTRSARSQFAANYEFVIWGKLSLSLVYIMNNSYVVLAVLFFQKYKLNFTFFSSVFLNFLWCDVMSPHKGFYTKVLCLSLGLWRHDEN